MFLNFIETQLASENHFEGVGFDYVISDVNLEFYEINVFKSYGNKIGF